MTNYEIEKYVEGKIQIKIAEQKAKEEELLKKKEAEERKQLEELKRKYE
jgi:DNA-directed RNA polymerase subunit L